ILLPPRDVAASMGTPSMEIANQSQQLRAPTGNLSNPDCLGAFEPIGESTYAGSGTKAVRGQQLHTPDNNLRVDEAVVGFPNAQRATAFVAAQAEQWKACAGQAVTLTTEHGREFHWTFGELTGTSPAITQVRMPRDPRRASCQRVLSAVSDVVFDVEACAANVADQGSQIADQMAAKVTPLARPG
ncbi:sensor domain-containing protein, partial [Mycobacterium sp.]|uniref:sensor domain-containing protein n=1 Tax=Mycobacterium sp. TaxID=1785 RepID=UPI00127F8CE6